MGRSALISLNTTQAHIQTPSRMNKLLMLAFLVALMGLMATAAPQDEVEELELEDMAEDEAMEDVVESREASAKESVDGSLATIKEDLEIATGSAPTDSEISSATTAAASSATSTSSARRNIVARHLLNRFN